LQAALARCKGVARRAGAQRGRAGQEGGGEQAEAKFAAMCGTDAATYQRDRPGMSAFVLEDGVVYHTYSTYARGVDGICAYTRGSIARLKAVTRQACGGAAMTSTTGAERSRGCRGAAADGRSHDAGRQFAGLRTLVTV
jgi:hypothetical protein